MTSGLAEIAPVEGTKAIPKILFGHTLCHNCRPRNNRRGTGRSRKRSCVSIAIRVFHRVSRVGRGGNLAAPGETVYTVAIIAPESLYSFLIEGSRICFPRLFTRVFKEAPPLPAASTTTIPKAVAKRIPAKLADSSSTGTSVPDVIICSSSNRTSPNISAFVALMIALGIFHTGVDDVGCQAETTLAVDL